MKRISPNKKKFFALICHTNPDAPSFTPLPGRTASSWRYVMRYGDQFSAYINNGSFKFAEGGFSDPIEAQKCALRAARAHFNKIGWPPFYLKLPKPKKTGAQNCNSRPSPPIAMAAAESSRPAPRIFYECTVCGADYSVPPVRCTKCARGGTFIKNILPGRLAVFLEDK